MKIFNKICIAVVALFALASGSLHAESEKFFADEILEKFDIMPAEGVEMTTTQYEGDKVIEFSGLYGEIRIVSRNSFRYLASGTINVYSNGSDQSFFMGTEVYDEELGNIESEGRIGFAAGFADYEFQLYNPVSGIVTIRLIKGKSDVLRLRSIELVSAGQESLWFDPDAVTIEAGEKIDMPTVYGNTGGYTPTFTSSDPSVVSVGTNARMLQAHKPGNAVIYATIPEAAGYVGGKGELQVTVTPYTVEGTTEVLTMPKAGALRELLADLPSDKIGSLSLTGPINSQDIIVLRGGNPRLSNLQRLDLSAATLDPDDGEYNSTSGNHDIGMGSTTIHYFLSADEHETVTSKPTGMGGGTVTIKRYTLDLGAAFCGLDYLTELILPNGLQRVGNLLASNCPELQIVSGPDQISHIEEGAFSGSSKLHSVSLGSLTRIDDSAFYATSISGIDLSTVTHLGESVFEESGITAANLSSLDSIPNSAFLKAGKLSQVVFSPKTVFIGGSTFSETALSGDIQLPSSVNTIGYRAFAYTGINNITGPAELLHVGSGIFWGTPMEERLRFEEPTDMVYIGKAAVAYYNRNHSGSEIKINDGTVALCGSLFHEVETEMKYVLPSSLKVIGDAALNQKGTGNLPESIEWYGERAVGLDIAELTIGENVTHIGERAFSNIPALLTLTYNTPSTDIELSSFPNTMEKVTIGPKARLIARHMFDRQTNLIRLNFEKREDKFPLTIGEYAFYNSGRITNARLPEGTDTIAERAFDGCTALSEIYIPSTTKYIAIDAFQNCPNLKVIYSYLSEPYDFEPQTRADSYVFPADATIYVLPNAVEAYKSSPQWGQWAIEPMDEEHLKDFDAGVSDSLADQNDPIVGVYDLNGRKVLNDSASGIYIVRHKSGKTTKVIR